MTSLSKSPDLQNRILSNLVKCIKSYSDTLRRSKEQQEEIEPHKYENIGRVFGVLEQCLKDGLTTNLSYDAMCDIRCQLENSLLHISNDFPLFAHYVWALNALIPS